MDFYTYAWMRCDGTPYYIGKGCRGRAYYRYDRTVYPPKDRSKIIITYHPSEHEAFAQEKLLIAQWGKLNNGTGVLRNSTDGGEGPSGQKLSPERRAEISRRMLGNKHSLGSRRDSPSTAAKLKARPHPDRKANGLKVSAAMKGKKKTEAHKQALRDSWNRKKLKAIGDIGEAN